MRRKFLHLCLRFALNNYYYDDINNIDFISYNKQQPNVRVANAQVHKNVRSNNVMERPSDDKFEILIRT